MALSLILSMLLFKPAPIYILDEVDAALDLSHTQNIGQMLRTHFTHSQVKTLRKLSAAVCAECLLLYSCSFVVVSVNIFKIQEYSEAFVVLLMLAYV